MHTKSSFVGLACSSALALHFARDHRLFITCLREAKPRSAGYLTSNVHVHVYWTSRAAHLGIVLMRVPAGRRRRAARIPAQDAELAVPQHPPRRGVPHHGRPARRPGAVLRAVLWRRQLRRPGLLQPHGRAGGTLRPPARLHAAAPARCQVRQADPTVTVMRCAGPAAVSHSISRCAAGCWAIVGASSLPGEHKNEELTCALALLRGHVVLKSSVLAAGAASSSRRTRRCWVVMPSLRQRCDQGQAGGWQPTRKCTGASCNVKQGTAG